MPHDAAARALDSCRRAPRPVSVVFWRRWRGETAVLIALAQSEPAFTASRISSTAVSVSGSRGLAEGACSASGSRMVRAPSLFAFSSEVCFWTFESTRPPMT